MPSAQIRIVLNQLGAFIELHGHHERPIVIGRLSNARVEEYRAWLIERHPDMRYASFGQVVQRVAEEWFAAIKDTCTGLTLNSHIWQYNASTNTYERR
jgi:hypothetical protein